MSRRRLYTLYAMSRVGPFSVYAETYGRGTHPWVIEVYAVSLKQAYALAAREVWSKDGASFGVRRRCGPGVEELAPWRGKPRDAA